MAVINSRKPIVIVGAGLYGLTLAERIANELGKEVLILEKREFIGGNAFSYFDTSSGIEIHKYGSHLFHTDNEKIWRYVNNFTSFNDYRHQVWAKHNNRIYPMPINLGTISLFCEKFMTPSKARMWIADQQLSNTTTATNFEEKAIQLIGEPLYRAFIAGYTEKQWQVDPKQLPQEIISRLPVRYNFNIDYFDDKYQGLPLNGYMNWFARMVENPLIKIETDSDYFVMRERFKNDQLVIFSGPIDRFFDYKYGALSWRTLDFEWEILATDDFQGASVINYSDLDVPFTRIHEFKHLHPERKNDSGLTVIAREYSRFALGDDDPYYPINTLEDKKKLDLYRALRSKAPNVIFGGRLGSYKYLDMHMAIGSALSAFEQKVLPMLIGGK